MVSCPKCDDKMYVKVGGNCSRVQAFCTNNRCDFWGIVRYIEIKR